jgi:hypothetical protein
MEKINRIEEKMKTLWKIPQKLYSQLEAPLDVVL